MTAPTMPYGYAPGRWLESPWQQWVTDITVPVGIAAERAARLLAAWALAAAAVLAAWPLRLAYRAWQWMWVEPERLVCSVVFGCPAALLVRMLPHVRWPSSYAEALTSLQVAGYVLGGVFLLLVCAQLSEGGSAGRCCGGGGHRHLVPSPGGTKTDRWIVAMHEAAHLVIGKALGRATGGARIFGGLSGLTRVTPKVDDPVGEIAIDLAGGIGARTQRGCSADQDNARSRAKQAGVPSRKRDAVYRKGAALARHKVASHRGEIERVARRLYNAPTGTTIH